MNREIEAQVFNLMDALRSPVLTHDVSWASVIPQRILNVIPLARMKALIANEEMATEPETVAFMMTRVMNAPMDHEWAEIYCYLGCKVCEDYFGQDGWDSVKAKRTLTEYEEKHHLLPLRKWIYERRRKALKEKLKAENYEPIRNDEISKPKKVKVIEKRQMELW